VALSWLQDGIERDMAGQEIDLQHGYSTAQHGTASHGISDMARRFEPSRGCVDTFTMGFDDD